MLSGTHAGQENAESVVALSDEHRLADMLGWKTFLRNHAAGIASIDLLVVRTISFKLLYGLVILRHARRRLVTISMTNNPTAEWIAGQVTDAFPWDEVPRHLIRDRDGAFGPAYTRRIRAMGIRDHPTAPRDRRKYLAPHGDWPLPCPIDQVLVRPSQGSPISRPFVLCQRRLDATGPTGNSAALPQRLQPQARPCLREPDNGPVSVRHQTIPL
jgi:hypothetical protein